MLNEIKDIINRKLAFQESADIIMESSSGFDLDDLIVLGESTEEDEFTEDDDMELPEDDEKEKDSDDNDDEDDDEKDDEGEKEDEGKDLMDTDIDSSDEQPESPSERDTLPDPIGAQTGEPVADNLDDLMKAEIDLKSNTFSDILPIPPANAGDAVATSSGEDEMDLMNQHIDSGFEEENEPELSEEAVSESVAEFQSIMKEACNELVRSEYLEEAKKRVIEVKKDGILKKVKSDANKGTMSKILDRIIAANKPIRVDTNGEDTPPVYILITEGFFNKKPEPKRSYSSVPLKASSTSSALSSAIKSEAEAKSGDDLSIKIDNIRDYLNSLGFSTQKGKTNTPYSFESSDNNGDSYTEAISLGDDNGGGAATDADPAPVDDNAAGAAPDANLQDPGPQENDVTAAVKDKVAEADAATETGDGSSASSEDGQPQSKEDLLKKLGNITKNLEDAKKAIMDSI